MVEPVFGRWGPNEVMDRRLDGTWAEVVDGMALIEPASIVFSGTSAAIVGLGSVEFSAVTSLSLNGVFSSLFDNYMINIRHVLNTSSQSCTARLRASGSDAAGSNYVNQALQADGTSVVGSRSAGNTFFSIGNVSATQRSGDVIYLYGPNLTQPTAMLNVQAGGQNSAFIIDFASTHSLSASYDGITFIPAGGSITGRVAVYGMVR